MTGIPVREQLKKTDGSVQEDAASNQQQRGASAGSGRQN